MSEERPLIFVTNDDSVHSKGIKMLVDTMKKFGYVVVIAPDSPQSGMGHAITIHDPIRLTKVNLFEGVDVYSCSGTPVDCVKIGIYEVMKRKPDLLVSGINHGANTATNVLYSGTMSAAVEGAMEGIPSIGFSLDSFDANADFTVACEVAESVISEVLKNGMMANTCLNVNIPFVKTYDHKGIKVCRQAHAYWEDSFDKRKDQFGKDYYWLAGNFKDMQQTEDTDLYWIEKGYSTVVPTQFDLTSYNAIKELENWEL